MLEDYTTNLACFCIIPVNYNLYWYYMYIIHSSHAGIKSLDLRMFEEAMPKTVLRSNEQKYRLHTRAN